MFKSDYVNQNDTFSNNTDTQRNKKSAHSKESIEYNELKQQFDEFKSLVVQQLGYNHQNQKDQQFSKKQAKDQVISNMLIEENLGKKQKQKLSNSFNEDKSIGKNVKTYELGHIRNKSIGRHGIPLPLSSKTT